MPKEQSRNRWFVKVVLGAASLAFIGGPMILMASGAFQSNPSHYANNHTVVAANQQEQLQTLADGYAEVVEREPENVVALQGLMQARLQLGQLQDAIAPMAKLSELDPNNLQLAVLLGRARLEAGDIDAAIAHLSALAEQHPENSDVTTLLGQAYTRGERHPEAIALYQSLVDSDPERSESTLLLAEALTRGDRRQEAFELYDRLIAERPEDFQPLVGKAIALASATEVTDAMKEEAAGLFEQAETVAPASTKAQIDQIAQQYLNPVTIEAVPAELNTSASDSSSGESEAAE
ncbi:MAG: tetratricopeptide repeat protein [Cyanobacteria bacterium J06642_2]